MKPLLALHVHPDAPDLTPAYLADLINEKMDREFARSGVRELVSVRLLANVEDLRAYEAGEMVLYRKPARKVGDRIVYERNGQRIELEQTRLALE